MRTPDLRKLHFFLAVGALRAGAPDHLQARPAALRRVEHQLVYEVAHHGEAEATLPVGRTRQIRDVEPAARVYDGYLDRSREHPVLDLVVLHRSVADNVGCSLGYG